MGDLDPLSDFQAIETMLPLWPKGRAPAVAAR